MSDEEYCDLETLEALLDADDGEGELPSSEPQQGQKQDFSQEMKEFLNAMSEESDDEEKPNASLKQLNNQSGKDKVSDTLTSKEKNGGQRCDQSEDKRKRTSNVSKISESMSEKKVKSMQESTDKEVPTVEESSTTLALQKELMLMQKKMEEMQKMLLEQQNKSSSKCDKMKAVKTKSPTNSSSGPIPTKNSSSKKLHLIGGEENPFFQKKEKEKTTPQNRNDKIKSVNKSNVITSESKKSVTSKQLFGDSDSDWDDLDGEERATLSEQGKTIKRLLNAGQRERQAHKPNFSLETKSTTQSDKWQKFYEKESRSSPAAVQPKEDKFALKCSSSSSDQSKPQASAATQNEKIVVEDFSRIRIINPLISSGMMRTRMEGRKLISVSKIYSKVNTPDLHGDWVTIGVVVGKSNAKTSGSGKTYSIWKLNDLHDLDNSVSFFLFGEVHKSHWKLDVGSVIGLLNPTMMEAMERGKSEPAFTLKNPNQLMVLGQSKDLGWCPTMTKKGNKCTHFVNKKQGDFCSFHVQKEYKKTSAKRLELQGSVTGIKPKSFEQKVFSKNCAYMYGGHAYAPNAIKSKSKQNVSLTKLQQNSNTPNSRINTLSLHNISASPNVAGQNGKTGRITEEKDQLFLDMLTTPTPGAMNLVAHLKHNEDGSKSTKSIDKSTKEIVIQSVSASDLLKKHKRAMHHKISERRRASDILLASGDASSSPSNPLKAAPVLGKGLGSSQDIFLSTSPPTLNNVSVVDRSKLKAIAMIQNKGGISKEDPNAVKKPMETKHLESIKKRLQKSEDLGQSPSSKVSSSSSSEDEPPKKKSRWLGNVDLNSAEVKAILKAKSKHKGALAEAEAEREDTYFSELEKKECMEEKMKSITSMDISVYTCKQCQYTAQSALPQCKTDGHVIVKTKAKKRFFACKKCKERTTTITSQFPTDACKKCGSFGYEKTSMYKEKAGPKLDSEILSHRGDEMKFLNSLHHKVYMNTVIDKE